MIKNGLNIHDDGAGLPEFRAFVLCPVCGYEFVHLREPRVDDAGDITIRGWCEGDHAFEICLSFHKGRTNVFTRVSDEALLSELSEAEEEAIEEGGTPLAARVISRFTKYGTGEIGDVPPERRCEATVALRKAARKVRGERLD